LPKNVVGSVSKHYKALAKAYDVLAEVFKDATPERLRAEIKVGPYRHDSNYSLALLVLAAHQRFKVQRLSETYASIPLGRVATEAFPAETTLQEVEEYIQNLIANSQLHGASLAKPKTETFLRFDTQGPAVSEAQLYRDLVMQRNKVAGINKHILETQHKVETTPHSLDSGRKARKAEEKATAAGAHGEKAPGSFDDDMVADM
jgi:hypothetical protein